MGTNSFRNSKDMNSFISIDLDINIVGPDLRNSSPSDLLYGTKEIYKMTSKTYFPLLVLLVISVANGAPRDGKCKLCI